MIATPLVLRATGIAAVALAFAGSVVEAREPSSDLYVLGDGDRFEGGSSEPYGDVEALADGGLLVATHWGDRRIYRLRVDGVETPVRLPVPGSDEFWRPRDLLPTPDGSTIVADHSTIWRVAADGAVTRVAGTGMCDFSGDGGRATDAQICLPLGLGLASDGSVLFADGGNHRIRRIATDGTITTAAGSDRFGFGGDGGPATAARLSFPTDVLGLADGGFLVADSFNGRVRRVTPDGRIVTIAGNDRFPFDRTPGDGGPATEATLSFPESVALLPDGTLLIGERCCIRHVGADGTITTLLDPLRSVTPTRIGDFAGRYAFRLDALAVTREGGIAISAVTQSLRAPLEARSVRGVYTKQLLLYLAPAVTARTLVAIRDARASENRIGVVVDATQAGTARLEVRRGDRLVAASTRRIRAGRTDLRVRGRFGARTHAVRVTLTRPQGASARDEVSLYTGLLLKPVHLRASLSFLGHVGAPICGRLSLRRIDCEIWPVPDPDEGGKPYCVATRAFRLQPSGVMFSRRYLTGCLSRRFRSQPRWSEPWQLAPVAVTGI